MTNIISTDIDAPGQNPHRATKARFGFEWKLITEHYLCTWWTQIFVMPRTKSNAALLIWPDEILKHCYRPYSDMRGLFIGRQRRQMLSFDKHRWSNHIMSDWLETYGRTEALCPTLVTIIPFSGAEYAALQVATGNISMQTLAMVTVVGNVRASMSQRCMSGINSPQRVIDGHVGSFKNRLDKWKMPLSFWANQYKYKNKYTHFNSCD